MPAPSKKVSILLLSVTAILSSRLLFSLFTDPEGPNVLIVLGMAGMLYAVSMLAYLPMSSSDHSRKFWTAMLIQALLAASFYFLLR